jgi:hypothetical protein
MERGGISSKANSLDFWNRKEIGIRGPKRSKALCTAPCDGQSLADAQDYLNDANWGAIEKLVRTEYQAAMHVFSLMKPRSKNSAGSVLGSRKAK